ncbi:NepR family anti-sigma factor [Kaistia granuli]|uniref:NepR family anti-sigma factor n=1 Tax=Kaistia granuli TaxID=363259 RepID=UPI00036E093A|nr:NepR family anti-sigma factor [Kaistia granuli]
MDKESMVKDAEFRSALAPEPSTQGEKEDWIGRQLRRVFDSALSEPLPDDIMSLLDRIDDAQPADKPEGSKGPA